MASKGLKCACYAIGTEANGAITYSNGALFDAVQETNIAWERNGETVYGNDTAILTDDTITGGTITLMLTHISDAIDVNVLGAHEGAEIDAVTHAKELSETSASEPAIIGTGVYGESFDDSGNKRWRAIWVKKVKFTKPNEEMTGKKPGATYKTPSLIGKIFKAIDDVFREKGTFSTEAGALAWLYAKAGISSAVSTGLTALSISNCILTPAFLAAIFNYSGAATNDVVITATAAGTIKLYVDGVYNQTLTAEVAGVAVTMAAGTNKIFQIVCQESGKAPITTTIMMQRAAG